MRLILLLLSFAACHPVVAIGYDTRPKIGGAFGTALQQPTSFAALGGTSTAPTSPEGDSYSLEVGGGARDFTISGSLRGHAVSRASLSMPGLGTPHYLAVSGNLDFGWTLLRYKALSTNLHAGPTRTLLLDRTSGDRSWGDGVRTGGRIALALKGLSIYGEYHRSLIWFQRGPAEGTSTITGLTVGVAWRP